MNVGKGYKLVYKFCYRDVMDAVVDIWTSNVIRSNGPIRSGGGDYSYSPDTNNRKAEFNSYVELNANDSNCLTIPVSMFSDGTRTKLGISITPLYVWPTELDFNVRQSHPIESHALIALLVDPHSVKYQHRATGKVAGAKNAISEEAKKHALDECGKRVSN